MVAEIAGLSAAQVDKALGAARSSFDSGVWSGLSMKQRAESMRRYSEALKKRAGKLKELAIAEAGCPVSSTVMGAQVHAPLRMTDEIVDLFLRLPEHEDNPLPLHERVNPYFVVQSLKLYRPLGVVSAISAYNVPFYTAFWKVIPALMAGNSVILRPNPLTPLSAMIFAEAADEAGLPKGVMNVIIENGLAGGLAMTTDERVDMVSFTGSCTVGAKVAEQSAPTLKRLVLELGGKSAAIFLPNSAERAGAHGHQVCTSHAGQGCVLGTRVFVPQDRKAEVLELMAAGLANVKIGVSSDPETQLGPVISAGQRARCEHFTEAAVAAGGRVVTGGKRPAHMDKGFFFEPTVLDLPDNKNPAAQEDLRAGGRRHRLQGPRSRRRDGERQQVRPVRLGHRAGQDGRLPDRAQNSFRRGQRQRRGDVELRLGRRHQDERPRPRARRGRPARVPDGDDVQPGRVKHISNSLTILVIPNLFRDPLHLPPDVGNVIQTALSGCHATLRRKTRNGS